MIDILTELQLSEWVSNMVRGRADVSLAVAYWGKDAIKRLGLGEAAGGRILCNPQLGYCDREVIRNLQKKFEVFAHPKLHAKVYMTTQCASIGSSNASSYGLAEILQLKDNNCLREMNVALDEQSILKQLHVWFDDLWKEKVEITPSMFRKIVGGSDELPKPGSFIEAVQKRPDYFSPQPIYFLLYKHYVDAKTKAAIKNKVKKLKVGNLGAEANVPRARSKSQTKLESLLGSYWPYTDWGKLFPTDAWLIDISRVRKTRANGIAQSISKVPTILLNDGTRANLGFRRRVINLNGIMLRLTDKDKRFLESRFDDLWDHAKGREDSRVLALGSALDVIGIG